MLSKMCRVSGRLGIKSLTLNADIRAAQTIACSSALQSSPQFGHIQHLAMSSGPYSITIMSGYAESRRITYIARIPQICIDKDQK
jgi:hypothetical protein